MSQTCKACRPRSLMRRHMKKPARRVRRFLKRRSKGKGKGEKGKGKGSARYSLLAHMTDDELELAFFRQRP